MSARDARRRAFLTAAWRALAILSFRIDAGVLRARVPAGTELDTWKGEALVSIVGFRFLDTRVLGVPVPFHRDFDEVNLRFYVRREHGGEIRRGVTFVREIVARRAVSLLARWTYDEPYVRRPMRSRVTLPEASRAGRVEYAWRATRGWNRLAVDAVGELKPVASGGEAEFITAHHWGYTAQRDGSTLEYEVAHPPWRIWDVRASEFERGAEIDGAEIYGAEFVEALSAPPVSALLADGSPVTVFRPERIAP